MAVCFFGHTLRVVLDFPPVDITFDKGEKLLLFKEAISQKAYDIERQCIYTSWCSATGRAI